MTKQRITTTKIKQMSGQQLDDLEREAWTKITRGEGINHRYQDALARELEAMGVVSVRARAEEMKQRNERIVAEARRIVQLIIEENNRRLMMTSN